MTYKVWWIPNPPRQGFEFPVSSPEIGAIVLDALAKYDLYLGDDVVFANAGGLLNPDNDEWETEEGGDVWGEFNQ